MPPTDPRLTESVEVGHEQSDVRARGIVVFLIGLSVATIIVLLGMRYLFGGLERRDAARAKPPTSLVAPAERVLPPEPRLAPQPTDELRAVRAEADSILGSYGWISREAGVVRIPIDRAVDLLLERGLPARPAGRGSVPPAAEDRP